jgi:hypothetical protein
MRVTEREITAEVELCRPDGTLNPDAVGWTRHPLHDTSRIGRGRRGWGRAKRWEYWAVTTPTHLVGVTVSSLDYAGVYAVWVHDRRSGETVSHDVIDPLGAWSQPAGAARRRPGASISRGADDRHRGGIRRHPTDR